MAMVFPFRDLQEMRRENHERAVDNAWQDFLTRTEEMVRAQHAMNEAHLRWLKLKSGTSHD